MLKYNYQPPQNGFPEWDNNPEIFQLNRLPAHATFIPYTSVKDAKADRPTASELFLSLNGLWKFAFAPNPVARIKDFYKVEYDSSDWAEIEVPSNWQLQGYDYPQYININYPWFGKEDIQPPFAPSKYNPVGSYVSTFKVPENWQNQSVFISFQGVESAFYIWLNGEMVGYSEDSFTPAEFDLTPYLGPGDNKLAVEVYRWSDASWLEDQDFWRLSGIFRDVYLFSPPNTHLYDFFVNTELDSEYRNAQLTVRAKTITNFTDEAGEVTLNATLYDMDDQVVFTQMPFTPMQSQGEQHFNWQIAVPLENPLKWSAEKPNLYTLVLSLEDAQGILLEAVSCKVGFHKFELKDGLMQINGSPIVFRGVNRHEFNPRTGRALAFEDMLKDVLLMKQNNINAVRTSHYPNNPLWLSLCDRYGIYLIDETNLETHGMWNPETIKAGTFIPGSKPEWEGAVMDRCNSMFQRDKNHPAVLLWSLGNEAYAGDVFLKMHDFLKEADPSRLVHYEGVIHWKAYEAASDIDSQMYVHVDRLEEYARSKPNKPIILCEYSHAMGNACGNLFKYWDLFDRYPILQGGFIWDWVDQALYAKSDNGVEYLAYGGDFGDYPNDSNFCGNGIIFADRSLSPKIFEVKKCYQSIKMRAVSLEKGRFEIQNRYLFTDLKEFRLNWKVLKNGEIFQEGRDSLELAPGTSREISLNYNLPSQESAYVEYVLIVSFHLNEASLWAEAGHEIAFEQFVLPSPGGLRRVGETILSGQMSLEVAETGEMLDIKGAGFRVRFSKANGDLVSYKVKDKELLSVGPVPNFWRAYTDSDRGNKHHIRCATWRAAGTERELQEFSWQVFASQVEVVSNYLLPTTNASFCKIRYKVKGNGEIEIRQELVPGTDLPEIPEIGLMLVLTEEFNKLEWYGKGPHENYWDRQTGAKIGIYKGKVADQYVPYLRPQECGNKVGVRRATLKDADGSSLEIFSGEPGETFELNVLPYTPFELENYSHPYQLPAPAKTVVRVNYKQMGVGGDDAWGAMPHSEFRLYANRTYSFSFLIKGT